MFQTMQSLRGKGNKESHIQMLHVIHFTVQKRAKAEILTISIRFLHELFWIQQISGIHLLPTYFHDFHFHQ
jgi:hypothetical protein